MFIGGITNLELIKHCPGWKFLHTHYGRGLKGGTVVVEVVLIALGTLPS